MTLKQKLKRKLGRKPWLDELESVRAARRAKAVEDESWQAKSVAAFCLQQVGEGHEADDADEDQWKRYFNERHKPFRDIEASDDCYEKVKAAAWKDVRELLRSEAFSGLDWSKQLNINTDEIEDGGDDLRELTTWVWLYSPFAMTRAVSIHVDYWSKPRAHSCEFHFRLSYILHSYETGVKEKEKRLCSTYLVDCPDDGLGGYSWSPVEEVKLSGFTKAAVRRIYSHLLGDADLPLTHYDLMHLLLAASGAFHVDCGEIPLTYLLKEATGTLSKAEREAHEPYTGEAAMRDWGEQVLDRAKKKAQKAYDDFLDGAGGEGEELNVREDTGEEDKYYANERAEWRAFWTAMEELEADPLSVWDCAEIPCCSLPWDGKDWAVPARDRWPW